MLAPEARLLCAPVHDEAAAALLEVTLAVHAWSVGRGGFPNKLTELVPKYLTMVPRDPFGRGEGLRYFNRGKHYLLYSIGPDGKDDGGRPIVNRTLVKRAGSAALHWVRPDSLGDMVAGINQ